MAVITKDHPCVDIFADTKEEDAEALGKLSKLIDSGKVHVHEHFTYQGTIDRKKAEYDEKYGDKREYTLEELQEKFKPFGKR